MIRALASALLAASLALGGCGAGAATEGGPVVLSGVTLIDGNGGPPQPDRTLLIQGGRIAAIYRTGSRPAPEGAEVRDLRGRFVMPGLIDSHVHLASQARPAGAAEEMLRLALLGGVTQVRDMGGNGTELRRLARAAASGAILSPRIHYAALVTGPYSTFWLDDERGRFVAGGAAPGTSAWFRRIDGGSDLRAAVAEARAFGASGLKVHSGVPAPLLRRLAAEARRQGLPVWAHAAINPAGPGDAVGAGVSALSHADMLAFEGHPTGDVTLSLADYRTRAWAAIRAARADSERVNALLAAMRARRVILEPTLFIMNFGRLRAEGEAVARLGDHVAFAGAVTRRANAAGVEIAAGTDSLLLGNAPNIHAELQLLVSQGGLTPLQAITAATRTGARLLGIARDYGTLAPGKVADLIVLERDPATDIRNTQTILFVMVGGRVHVREAPLRPAPPADAPRQTAG